MKRIHAVNRKKFDRVLKSVADLFRVLAHPDRLRIIGLLKQQEMDVTQLQESIGISHSSVSQHLKLLKMLGLVVERREGKHVFYDLKNPKIKYVIMSAIELQAKDLAVETESISLLEEMRVLWASET